MTGHTGALMDTSTLVKYTRRNLKRTQYSVLSQLVLNFGIVTFVGLDGTLIEAKICTFKCP